MKILAIHDGHNASVCLLDNGKIIYASQEERYTNIKNQGGLPVKCLEFIDSTFNLNSIDKIIFVGNSMNTSDWSRESILNSYKNSDSKLNFIKHKIKNNKQIYSLYQSKTNIRNKYPKVYLDAKTIDHHICHASTAYFGLGNYDDKILVITADGEGDSKSATASIGYKGNLKEIITIPAKDSLGRLYSYITYLYNMIPYEHEYKIMGLAPYCNDKIRIEECKLKLRKIINFSDENSLKWTYLGKYSSIQNAGKEIKNIFNSTRFDVMATSIQELVEEIIVEWITRVIKYTGIKKITLAGGIFMNVKANMLISQIEELEDIFIFPSCGDESNIFGAVWNQYFQETKSYPDKLEHFYFGTEIEFLEEEILEQAKINNWKIQKQDNIEKEIAILLSKGEIVGRVKGNMEFGARSLGNRAILANPSIDGVLKTINEMIKGRDFWMPFAPSLLEEDLKKYFQINSKVLDYDYMIFTANSNPNIRKYAKNALHPYDFTGRPQAVTQNQNSDYYNLLKYYKEITGESLILNTSYNLHGLPMVSNMEQALYVFKNSKLKFLALNNYLLKK
ncbi:Carbamoyltransferase [hydrothermal vent metagenome]|uniref:Carbamoyltransferase n=1 Tax=hydrothermal vent metagenome TaxID=652676 RepID=A0A1W1EIE5_9ZZZZ